MIICANCCKELEGTVVKGWIITKYSNDHDYELECLDCGKVKHMSSPVDTIKPHGSDYWGYCRKLYRAPRTENQRKIFERVLECENCAEVAKEFDVSAGRVNALMHKLRDRQIVK